MISRSKNHEGSNIDRSPYYGCLQRVVDDLFAADDAPYMEQIDPDAAFKVRRLDVILECEAADLPEEVCALAELLPPGQFTRHALCVQLNSAINGHAWGQVYGTVE
jgi:hypothetical protein